MSTDWPEAWADALSDASLKEASSAAIFRRGQTYAASGAVEVTEEAPLPEPSLSAQVMGSETYSTEVWIEDDALAGICDCPNAEEGWFCKHQVAVAIVWRERLACATPNIDATAKKLGVTPAEYITKNYATLFMDWKQSTNSPANEMTFKAIKR